MLRTIPFDPNFLSESELEFYDFCKIEGPGAIGTRRLTNRLNGFVGNIDGSSQVWQEAGLDFGPIKMSIESVQEVTWISLVNVDHIYTNLSLTPGFRDCVVSLYTGWWRLGVFQGAIKIYGGRIDDGGDPDDSGIVKITLKPHYTPWAIQVPHKFIGNSCIHIYRDEFCKFAGAEPIGEETCGFQFEDCEARSNTINFAGFPFVPKVGEEFVIRSFF